MAAIRCAQLDVYRTAIPMRSFEHAAASRDAAEAVVVRLELSDGAVGWGETLPREYVTGETLETVAADLEELIWPAAAEVDLADPAAAEAIPDRAADGRCINAACCAVELATMDCRLGRAAASGSGSQRLGRPGRPACRPGRIDARVSGVLGSADSGRTARRLRLMQWFGLRDFKLKLGFGEETDAENLRVVDERIGKAVAAGRCSLRVDVNGAWDADAAPRRVAELERFGVCVVEQPVCCPAGALAELAGRCELPLMADESLLTIGDARELLAAGNRVWWNIRLSKNGGLTRSATLAELATDHDVPFVVGCMVGESSLLSAAQRRLLQMAPVPRFVEGNYGRFLLAGDLTDRRLRFGYGGRLKALPPGGLGVTVDPQKLARYGRRVKTLRA